MKKKYTILFLGLLLLGISFLGFLSKTEAAPSLDQKLYGYAWAPNIGWISLSNCDYSSDPVNGVCSGSDYGVKRKSDTGKLEGYAWAPNVGWIKFDQSMTGPQSNGNPATMDSSGKLTGWANIFSFSSDSECSSTTTCASNINDGWINFNVPTNGVIFDTSTNTVSGYGWGGNTVGWIDFSKVKITPIDNSNAPTVTLKAVNSLGVAKAEFTTNEDVYLKWDGTNLAPGKCDLTGDYSASALSAPGTKNIGTFSSPTILNFKIKCIGTNGASATNSAEATIVVNITVDCSPDVYCSVSNSCEQNTCLANETYSSSDCSCHTITNTNKKVPHVKEN